MTIRDDILQCTACKLAPPSCSKPVPYSGEFNSPIMLIGEAPGKDEDITNEPFVGQAGKELNKYLSDCGVSRHRCYVTNTVKCKPPGNRTPEDDEIAACSCHLKRELQAVRSVVIGLLGATATHAILGTEYDLDVYNGVPVERGGRVYVPVYHPAAGLHDTTTMLCIRRGISSLIDVYKGRRRVSDFADGIGDATNYREIKDDPESLALLHEMLYRSDVLSIDTETDRGEPWSIQVSAMHGEAVVIVVQESPLALSVVTDRLNDPKITCLIHNSMFDLPVLEKLGIFPCKVFDTMVAAHLLQYKSKGLKNISRSLCGMDMRTYAEITKGVGDLDKLSYLEKVKDEKWSDPKSEPVYNDSGKLLRFTKPWSVNRRVERIIADFLRSGMSLDLDDRFENLGEETIVEIEDKLGPFPEATIKDVDRGMAINYAARDADATVRIFPKIKKEIVVMRLEPAMELDMAVVPMVCDMQSRGMLVDKEILYELRDSYIKRKNELQDSIEANVGMMVNPGSSKQVGEVVYGKLGLRSRKKTKKGANATDVKALQPLADSDPVVRDILEWRRLQKLITTYLDVLILKSRSSKDGRIRAKINLTSTNTGRLSTSNPNFMAIPTRTEEGKALRTAFVPEEGCCLVSCDYSQLEMVVTAHFSKDEEMLRIFRGGEDLHTQTAARIFGIPVSKVDKKKHRYPAKRIGFGTLYGIQAEGLYDQLAMEGLADEYNLEICDQMIREWFNIYKGVRVYFNKAGEEAKAKGYVREDFYGRLRYIPEVFSVFRYIREAGIRQACSMKIQGAAQQVMKKAMAQMTPIYKGYLSRGYVCYPLIQIHDDLVWEVSLEILYEFVDILTSTMRGVFKLEVPLECEPSYGFSWGEMIDCSKGE